MSRTKRMKKELQTINQNDRDFFHLDLSKENQNILNVTILGPPNSVYRQGVFAVQLKIPEAYPFRPPSVIFKTKIFHPAAYRNGHEVYFSLMLTDRDNWSPAFKIKDVIFAVYCSLNSPDLENYCSFEVNFKKLKDKGQFERIAKEWTKKYAT